MAIYLDSRYAEGAIFKAWDARKNQYQITVFRNWPTYTQRFFFYEWKDTDRPDIVANKFLNNSDYWWMIMDINPEIVDPLDIAPGTNIRIPYA